MAEQKPFENHEEFMAWALAKEKATLKKYWKKGRAICTLQRRTLATATQIIEGIDGIPFEKFSLLLYNFTKDEAFRDFCRSYEYQIEMAAIDRDKFADSLDKFYNKQAEKIKERGLLHPFLEFLVWFMDKQNTATDETSFQVYTAYSNLILQQLEYLRPNKYAYNEMLCGITTAGDPITIPDPLPNIDWPSSVFMYETFIEKKPQSMARLAELYAQYGYSGMEDPEKNTILTSTSRFYTNDVVNIAPYINEYTFDIVPVAPFIPDIRDDMWGYPVRIDFSLEEILSHRRRTLPANGLKVTFTGARLFQTLLLKECYHNSEIVLLFRYTTKMGDVVGCYLTKSQIFRSTLERATVDNEYNREVTFSEIAKKIAERARAILKHTTLWAYASFVCNDPRVLPTSDGYQMFVFGDPASVQFSSIGGKLRPVKEPGTGKKRTTDTETYNAETRSINGYVRRLPEGQKASEKAKLLAQSLGFELDEGETYVQPFIRMTWVVRNDRKG